MAEGKSRDPCLRRYKLFPWAFEVTVTGKKCKKLGRVTYTCNPSSEEAEAGGLWVKNNPGYTVR